MKILITGATDGIGLATAKKLTQQGHHVLLHGRNTAKLKAVARELGDDKTEQWVADFSKLAEVKELAEKIAAKHKHLDVLINNAGVFNATDTVTDDGLDIRFAVNTVAPYLLTKSLLSLMDESGRIINLSSVAQQPLDMEALMGQKRISDGQAYAQSKLGLTMWSIELAKHVTPVVVAINPKSLLGTKMVKKAFGTEGHDLTIGADLLCRAALTEEFVDADGKYYDNDQEAFGEPHPDAKNAQKATELMKRMDTLFE
ncbi:SDR family NAD(P)-dependent oxidoreductase [Planococcus maritimus]|uniref:SDR family NAD(P)-dependent oxidoreductase n=1 Tax=Planococcus maritimus TaxID=192421 RepID=UPI000A7AC3E4|nr:SDR family NAD(P)-dependent oxidoreductase [Planococcus maritimus]